MKLPARESRSFSLPQWQWCIRQSPEALYNREKEIGLRKTFLEAHCSGTLEIPQRIRKTVQTKPAKVEKGVTQILGWFLNIWLWLEFFSWVISTLLPFNTPHPGEGSGNTDTLVSSTLQIGKRMREKPFPVCGTPYFSVCEWVTCS